MYDAAPVSLARRDLLVAAVAAVLILGPALRPGPLLHLDLLATPEIPVPNGIFGLGPGLSQRVPLFGLLGLGSWILGGPLTVKVFLLVSLVLGHLGMVRLAGRSCGFLGRSAAGLLWIGGPFVVTRLAVGHLQFAWLVAVLPWVVVTLLAPSSRLRHTFLGVALLAFGGPASGAIALLLVAVGLVVEDRPRRPLPVIGLSGVASLLWIGPTVVLLWAGAKVSGATEFPTSLDGVDGWLGALVGGGFWLDFRQVGGRGWMAAAIAVLLTVLAVVGSQRLGRTGRRLAVAAVAGIVLAVASGVPGLRTVYDAVARLPFGAPLRESHRFLMVWLLWLAPASAAGAAALAEAAALRAPRWSAAVRAVPIALVLLVSVGGWWGIDGGLEPRTIPAGWAAARDLVRSEPATTVAFPWHEYLPLSFTDGRNTLNPLPDYLGGDVISSFDPEFDAATITASAWASRPVVQEQVDRRAWYLDQAVRSGADLGPAIEAVGARWVVLAHEFGAPSLAARLEAEPDRFRTVLRNANVTVYEVIGWQGAAVDSNGQGFAIDQVAPPLLRTKAPAGSALSLAAAPGWVQGWFAPLGSDEAGRAVLPAGGSGPVWFWPALPLVVIDAAIVVAAGIIAGRSRTRARTGR